MINEGNAAILSVFDDLYRYFSFLRDLGWAGFECRKDAADILETWGKPIAPQMDSLNGIRADLDGCRRCKLGQSRGKIVLGAGNERAGLVFVGDGPDNAEDQAGELLTKIIGAIRMTRKQVYICNVVKCRPPDNREPEPDEIAVCSAFLKRQLKVIRPAFICALGTAAAQTLLETDSPISALRGRFHDCHGMSLLPTYHPADLLRHPEHKRDVWEDMKLLMNAMGTPMPDTR